MKNATVKFSPSTKEVQEVTPTLKNVRKRIDEEGLFSLFTADIIRLKTKFTR